MTSKGANRVLLVLRWVVWEVWEVWEAAVDRVAIDDVGGGDQTEKD